MSDIVINGNIIILLSGIVFLIVIGLIGYIIYKDHKQDKDEIEELLQNVENGSNKQDKEEIESLSEIEQVLTKMQKDLEAKPEEVVAHFEQEQEEKAIISYQELVKTLKKGKEDNVVKIEDKDLEEPKKEMNLKEIVEEIKNPKQEEKKSKFKNSEFISPIYGKMNEKLQYPKIEVYKETDLEDFDKVYDSYNIENYLEEFSDNSLEYDTLEQTLDLEPITEEIKKNEDFLKALKEFRENL